MINPRLIFFIKFLLSGGVSACVLYLLLILFHSVLDIHVVVSSSLAYAISIVVGFTAQKYWTFGNASHLIMSQFIRYALIGVFNIGCNALLMYLWTAVLGINYLVAQLISLTLITGWSFLAYRKFVFSKPQESIPRV